jgi:hypothetical protein
MRKIISYPTMIFGLLLAGCPNPWTPTETPMDFTQKVLLEEATGTWCGWCPQGAVVLSDILEAHPDVVIGAAYHVNDEMQVGETAVLGAGLGNIPFYPSGAINRTPYSGNTDPTAHIFMTRSYWSSVVDTILANTAACGLKLVTSVSGAEAEIRVLMGFHEAVTGDIRVSVLVTEDGITGYNQANYDSSLGGDQIAGYVFNHVVRKYITPVFGDTLDLTAVGPGKGLERDFSYTIPSSFVQANLNIIAMVHAFGPYPEDKKILNAQSVKLGETKEWD